MARQQRRHNINFPTPQPQSLELNLNKYQFDNSWKFPTHKFFGVPTQHAFSFFGISRDRGSFGRAHWS
eukprot:scaffold667_cov168-Ochromonas_danica.AAC.18